MGRYAVTDVRVGGGGAGGGCVDMQGVRIHNSWLVSCLGIVRLQNVLGISTVPVYDSKLRALSLYFTLLLFGVLLKEGSSEG